MKACGPRSAARLALASTRLPRRLTQSKPTRNRSPRLAAGHDWPTFRHTRLPATSWLVHLTAATRVGAATATATLVLGQLAAEPPPLHDALTAIVLGAIALHAQSPRLHRVLFEEAPEPEEIRKRAHASFDSASALIAEYLAKCPQVTAPDPTLAAGMVAQVVDELTHGAVIHPRDGADAEVYARETVTMLERYLSG